MLHSIRSVCGAALCAVLALGAAAQADSTPADPAQSGSDTLARYVTSPDPSFAWSEVHTGRVGTTSYVELRLTSQTWRGVTWRHQLFVLRPAWIDSASKQGLLFIDGGRWKPQYETPNTPTDLPSEARLFARLAETLHAPIGVLRQVPFQPMFDRTEDALIAYTFDRYLATGESDWPLLLPMVKSAARAMDVIQEVASERWGAKIDSFTVSGASKRGWTAWLTAAIDPRVRAVAPMVIDVLNMSAQMAHQRATWGDVSDEIGDYSQLGLTTRLQSTQGQALLSIVDPYSYRANLTEPKLILLSTNDRFWPLDALKLYWSDLPQPKNVLYVPNQGHRLQDVDRVIGALSAVHRYSASHKPMPRVSWTVAPASPDLAVEVKADRPAQHAQIWRAQSATLDFRDARWTPVGCTGSQDAYKCQVERAKQGYTALFAEMTFKDNREMPFSLSTTVCIAGPPASDPRPQC